MCNALQRSWIIRLAWNQSCFTRLLYTYLYIICASYTNSNTTFALKRRRDETRKSKLGWEIWLGRPLWERNPDYQPSTRNFMLQFGDSNFWKISASNFQLFSPNLIFSFFTIGNLMTWIFEFPKRFSDHRGFVIWKNQSRLLSLWGRIFCNSR